MDVHTRSASYTGWIALLFVWVQNGAVNQNLLQTKINSDESPGLSLPKICSPRSSSTICLGASCRYGSHGYAPALSYWNVGDLGKIQHNDSK
jgi:hypothetical protein